MEFDKTKKIYKRKNEFGEVTEPDTIFVNSRWHYGNYMNGNEDDWLGIRIVMVYSDGVVTEQYLSGNDIWFSKRNFVGNPALGLHDSLAYALTDGNAKRGIPSETCCLSNEDMIYPSFAEKQKIIFDCAVVQNPEDCRLWFSETDF